MIKNIDPRECVHRDYIKQLVALPSVLGVKACGGYQSCQINELISLHERHLKPTKQVDKQAMSIYMRCFHQFCKKYPVKHFKPFSRSQVIKESPQNRRTRIKNAYDNINKYGELPPGFKIVRAFLKKEKHEDDIFNPLESKAPRMIQHRSDEYCYELARYIKPLEKYVLYTRYGRYCKSRDRIFIKGMDSYEIADNLFHMGDKFPNPVWIPLDHSKYDAHLNYGIRGFFRIWMKACYRNDHHFKMMIDCQARNKCKTANNIMYEMQETLCSGEILTSFEGSVDNYALALEFTRYVSAEIRVNGDDMMICLDRSEIHLIDFDFYERACMSTKLLIVDDIFQIEFCQCRIVIVNGKPRMVRNPSRVIARTCYTLKTFPNVGGYEKLLGSIGLGELHCNSGVPILQSWAQLLIRSAHGQFSENMYIEYMSRRHERRDVAREVTNEARQTFDMSYNISPSRQRELESFFDQKKSLTVLAQVGR